MIDFSKLLFDEALHSNKPIFIDFYAIWCGPCVLLQPIFEKISKEYREKCIFGKINIDENREIAIKYRISSIPTIICIKNKTVVWTHVGLISEHELKNVIQKIAI